MRIRYAEEEDYQNQAALWEANLERSLMGKKGQAALQRLEAALLALPEKKLVSEVIEDDYGNVCALGALAKYEGYQGSMKLPEPPTIDDDDAAWDEWDFEGGSQVEEAMLDFAARLKVPRLVAIAIIERNDDGWREVTPEGRYERVLRWTQKRITIS